MEELVIHHIPPLSAPRLVAGFAGWPNAAAASTATIAYLCKKLEAERFAQIEPYSFYNFSSLRPVTLIKEGSIRGLEFPNNDFYFWKNKLSGEDIILFLGTEPQIRWDRFADCILSLVQEVKVKWVYTIGGTYDRVPHTKEARISMVVNDPSLIKEVEPYEVGLIEYQGPSSIHTFLLTAFRRKGIPAVSLWGHAPYYIQVENYKVVYALLRRLTKMLGIEINLEDIKVKALYLDEQVNKAISQNPQLESYVKKLEEEFEAIGEYGQPIEGAEEIIKEVEKFLRGQQY